jgi:ubiquinone/menaquinone biosynthesis C-methylase UbiE
VLDVCAGRSGFALHAKKFAREVIRIDMNRSVKPSVVARAEQLPFRDKTFDTIVSSSGIPMHSANSFDGCMAIRECLRVLKTGGKLFIHPISKPTIKYHSERSEPKTNLFGNTDTTQFEPFMLNELKKSGFKWKTMTPESISIMSQSPITIIIERTDLANMDRLKKAIFNYFNKNVPKKNV